MNTEKAIRKLEETKHQLISEIKERKSLNCSLNFNENDFINLIEQVKTGQYKAIQNARRWQQEYITTKELMTLFSNYLTALSATMTTFSNRLFILYLVNDILNHCFLNNRRDLMLSIQSSLLALLRLSYYISDAEKDKIEDLLNLWNEKKYFSEITMKATRAGLMVPPSDNNQKSESTDNSFKTKNYIKPSQHGRQGASYWELPAACMIPLLPDSNIIKESMQSYISIPSHLCQPITLSNQTSPEVLNALDSFYEQENMNLWDFKEESDTENEDIDYEGWSKKFWEQKEKNQKKNISAYYEQDRKTRRSESLSSRSSRSSRSRGRSDSISSRSYLSSSRSRTRSRTRSRSLSPEFQKSDSYIQQKDEKNIKHQEQQNNTTFHMETQTSQISSLQHSTSFPVEPQTKQVEYSKSQRTKEIAIKRGWKVR